MTADWLNEYLRLFTEPLEQLWGAPGPHRQVAEGSCRQTRPGDQRSADSYFCHFRSSV